VDQQSETRVYEFVKKPLIDKFGEAWYKQLEIYVKEYKKISK